MMLPQRFYILCLAAALLVPIGACKRKEKLLIGVVPKGQSQIYWTSVHAGAAAAAMDLGIDIVWNGPASEIDFTRQINIVDDFINRRVNGIVLAPSHGESLIPIVERAFQEKIPVAILDSGIQTEKYLSYISTDNYKGGVVAARRLGSVLPQQAKLAIIGTIPGSVSTAERENGFRETLAREFPGMQVVAFQYGMADRAKSTDVAEDIYTANPDLAGVFCSAEAGTIGAIQAARSKGMVGRVRIVGFDTSPTLIEDLQAGQIDSLVVQNPFRMGYLGVKTVVDAIRGQPTERRIDTGATLVTAENLNRPEIKELIAPPIAKYLR